MKLLKTLVLAATSAWALSSAQASVLSYNGFSRDTESSVVTGHGQDWMMWTETLGKSIEWFKNDPAAQHLRDAGWQLAQREQMNELFNRFAFEPGLVFTGGILTDEGKVVFYDRNQAGVAAPFRAFVGLFGDTYQASGLSAGPWWTERFVFAAGAYDGGPWSNPNHRYVGSVSDWDYNGERAEFRADVGFFNQRADWWDAGSLGETGLSLYRNVASVPVPGTLPLGVLGLAVAMVITLRRRT